MNIALAIDSLPPFISGVSIHYLALSEELLKAGHKVLIFTPKLKQKPKLSKTFQKAKIVFLPSFPLRQARGFKVAYPFLPKITMELRKFNADIIESSGPTFLGIDTLIASKIIKKPCVSYFYTLLNSSEYVSLIANGKYARIVEKLSTKYNYFFYKNIDAVFTPTPKVKEIVSRLGVPEKKIIIAPVFTDIKVVDKPKNTHIEKVKNKHKLRGKVAVYLGRLSKEKKLDHLIDIWQKVVTNYKNATLLIIGGGNYREQMEKSIKKKGLENSIRFTGELSHKEILKSKILSACDLYISASTSETFGIAGLEAMAHGLPVILSDSQGLCEISDGAAILCKPNDMDCFARAVLTLFKNENLRRKMSQKAQKIAESYNSEVLVRKLIKKYEGIIDNYKPSRISAAKLKKIMETDRYKKVLNSLQENLKI